MSDFPQCTEDRPYRCGNGECIPMDRVCDTHVDCFDMTDETRCGEFICIILHNCICIFVVLYVIIIDKIIINLFLSNCNVVLNEFQKYILV